MRRTDDEVAAAMLRSGDFFAPDGLSRF